MGSKPLGGSFERPPKPNPAIRTCSNSSHIGRLRAKTRQDSPISAYGRLRTYVTPYANPYFKVQPTLAPH